MERQKLHAPELMMGSPDVPLFLSGSFLDSLP